MSAGAKHLMVVAAGTGGHVMPGLAVAEVLRARGWSISWLGTRTGMERQLVEPRKIAFDAIDFMGFSAIITFAYLISRGIAKAGRVLEQ